MVMQLVPDALVTALHLASLPSAGLCSKILSPLLAGQARASWDGLRARLKAIGAVMVMLPLAPAIVLETDAVKLQLNTPEELKT